MDSQTLGEDILIHGICHLGLKETLVRKEMRSRGTVSMSTVHDTVLNGNKRPNQYVHKMLIMI